MTRSRLFFAAVLLTAAMGHSFAQKVGTTSLQFLKVMPNARAAAMGEAYVSIVSGIDGVFWNPAAVAYVSGHEASITHIQWIFETSQNALAYGVSLGNWGSVAAQFQFTDVGTIKETRVERLGFVGTGAGTEYNPGLTGETFTPISWIVGVTYAKSLTDKFSSGLSVKYAYESLWRDGTAKVVVDSVTHEFKTYASTFLFDFGMQYETGFRSTKIGASVQNFGPQVQFARDRFAAPLHFRLGISSNILGLNALFVEDPLNRVTFSYDILQPNDYNQQMHFGVEYEFGSLLAFRSGYKLNYDTDGWTFGGGVRTDLIGFLVGLDYSYADMGKDLGQVHRLSLGFNFP